MIDVSNNLNQSGADGQFQLIADRFYLIPHDSAQTEFFKPASNPYSVKITYTHNTDGGGYLGSPWHSIGHFWKESYWKETLGMGGMFDSIATRGLTHEFSHSRGAIDLYATQVSSPDHNPIDGKTYTAPQSIMRYHWEPMMWDPHTVAVLNHNAGNTFADDSLFCKKVNPISVYVRDASGKAAAFTQVQAFAVGNYSDHVSPTPVFSGNTDAQGRILIPKSVYGNTLNPDYHVCTEPTSNLLIRAGQGSLANSTWASFDSASLSAFRLESALSRQITLNGNLQQSQNLGPNNSSNYILVNGSTHLTIDQFPSWNFNKVKISLSSTNTALRGTVNIGGRSVDLSGWYQTITLDQSSNQAIQLDLTSSQTQNIVLQWWVEN